MKWKVPLAIAVVVILVVSLLVVYYFEFGPGSSSSWGSPSLVYDFNSTIKFDQSDHNLGGSFLGWNASGYVRNNESDAVTIHYLGSLSRQFMALSSKVNVGFDWTLGVLMVVSRRLNGVYSDVTYSNGESVNDLAYTNANAFNVDNGTTFTVRFEASVDSITYLFRVKLWNSAEVP
jgi:hypothetical protein